MLESAHGIAAAVCLKGVHAEGKSDYLKPLVRALIVLVVVEVIFNIVQWFGMYLMCTTRRYIPRCRLATTACHTRTARAAA